MVLNIPDGDRGIEATVAYISKFVQSAVHSADVNRLAISILQNSHAAEHNTTAEAKALFNWVHKNFRFVGESEETLRPVDEILRVRAGDCDDLNGILLPSLLLSVGIPVRLVTVATESQAPEQFSHIYPEAWLNNRWVAMDVARPGARFGREPEHYFRKRIWHIAGDHYTDVGRLRGMGTFNWAQLLQAGTYGTAQILSAAKTGIPPLPQQQELTPAVSSTVLPNGYTQVPTANLSGGFNLNSTDIVLGVVVLAALMMMGGRRR